MHPHHLIETIPRRRKDEPAVRDDAALQLDEGGGQPAHCARATRVPARGDDVDIGERVCRVQGGTQLVQRGPVGCVLTPELARLEAGTCQDPNEAQSGARNFMDEPEHVE